MNVSTIVVEPDFALAKLEEYRQLQGRQTSEDRRLIRLYRAIKKGARVLNVAQAFKETGLNDLGQPKLAIARADWKTVWCYPRRGMLDNWWPHGAVGFTDDAHSFNGNATARNYCTPDNTFDDGLLVKQTKLSSPVPHMPPSIRPHNHFDKFHILFEVEEWTTYPVDPYLLKRIHGDLFVVIAEWELTELEASLLGSMRQGGS